MMRGNDVMGILFAYVHEERVRELTENRVMASIPYGGRYRLVDFALSNLVNSGVKKVGVITEQNYQSLMDHLGSGKTWNLSRKREGLFLLPPFGADISRTDGLVTSLASIHRFLRNSKEEYVLFSNCDTVSNIDYNDVFRFHAEKDADMTIIYRHGTSPDTDRNVIYTVDPEGAVRDVLIKRGGEANVNYGFGKCIIRRKKLIELVDDCMSRNLYDFDRDLLQRNIKDLRVYGYEATGAAYTISSLSSFFDANMALMDPKVRGQLFPADRPIYTKVRDDMPAKYGLGSSVTNSIVADGCVIDGEVENCVLFRGVKVKKGAKLKNCVIMQDCVIGEHTKLDYVVTDKNVEFEANRTMSGYQSYPVYVAKGSKV
ncbi:glucose-1-phosphate adenylyltransferase subunit GlgD [Acutalibacter intestini]|uniref:glucose-1-phosphate adenylyltransferase subunit GlgD n=1 Tax=Acutalibacter intestini TaxID=3093659 RepID=UPI002AC9184C|nr:glucose-1-phosphate adenylyltransferase subunit GlgD [Acutalibacter sp. M00204]